jgi:hypothetical protein
MFASASPNRFMPSALPNAASPTPVVPTVSGSRWLDLLAVVLLAGFLLSKTEELPAFFEVTVVRIEITYLAPDGTRHPVPTPARFEKIPYATGPPETTLRFLGYHIEDEMENNPPEAPAAAGGRFEWVVRYAYNSMELDRRKEFVFGPKE